MKMAEGRTTIKQSTAKTVSSGWNLEETGGEVMRIVPLAMQQMLARKTSRRAGNDTAWRKR